MLQHGPPLTPNEFWNAWNFAPSIIVPLVLIGWIYIWGVQKLWQNVGIGHGITYKNSLWFLGALGALFLAFVSPLDAWSDTLFSAHMVQHMILILVAAPLLVMSDLHLALMWALPRRQAHQVGKRWRRSSLNDLWKRLTNPVFACALFALTLWGWHAAVLYEIALHIEWLHWFEHFVFLTTAILFWWVMLKPSAPKRNHYGMAILYLFATVLQSGILGALMSFSSEVWYPYYASSTNLWGLTPLQDQQLAGLIMWIPVGSVFTLLTIGYFAAWLNMLEKRGSQLPRNTSFSSAPREQVRLK